MRKEGRGRGMKEVKGKEGRNPKKEGEGRVNE